MLVLDEQKISIKELSHSDFGSFYDNSYDLYNHNGFTAKSFIKNDLYLSLKSIYEIPENIEEELTVR